MIIRILLASLLLVPAIQAAPASIVGTWELIAATPVDSSEIDPHGFMNHKTRYTAEGRIYMVPANEKLDETAYARYSFDGRVRTIVVPDQPPVRNKLSIDGDLMTLSFPSGRKLTYRRMSGERPYDRILEPRSLEVLKSSKPAPLLRYDSRENSKQPFAQRIRGIWEVVSYADLRYEVPPHGLPNDKYVITATHISLVPPGETAVAPDAPSRYQSDGKETLTVDGERWRIRFDQWRRMVIHRDQDEITLRLVQKATTPVPRIPVTVALIREEPAQ